MVRFADHENFYHGWSHGSSRLFISRHVAERGILSAMDFCDGRPCILNPQTDASKPTWTKRVLICTGYSQLLHTFAIILGIERSDRSNFVPEAIPLEMTASLTYIVRFVGVVATKRLDLTRHSGNDCANGDPSSPYINRRK